MENHVVDRVLERVEDLGYGPELPQLLRSQFPDLHFTFCVDDDVLHREPVRSCSAANLYLVTKTSHCLELTNELSLATGLVVADVTED